MCCNEDLAGYTYLALVLSRESQADFFDEKYVGLDRPKDIEDPDNELWLSPISIWEALLLAEKGRIVLPPEPRSWVQSVLQQLELREALLNYEIALLSRQITCPHQDPADRFLAATAIYYNLQLATMDQNLIDTPSLQTMS
jgi:PIN domain nuclease of toxin-antitoxin system